MVAPASSPTTGQTPVTIKGTGFFAAAAMRARFTGAADDVVVTATFFSSTSVKAVAPAVTAAGPFSVFVSMNNQDYTATNASFTYCTPRPFVCRPVY
jgi:hypothetical protein